MDRVIEFVGRVKQPGAYDPEGPEVWVSCKTCAHWEEFGLGFGKCCPELARPKGVSTTVMPSWRCNKWEEGEPEMKREDDKGHQFEGEIEAETPKAVKFRAHNWDEALWFPKSQIYERHDLPAETVIVLSSWICGKNGVSEDD